MGNKTWPVPLQMEIETFHMLHFQIHLVVHQNVPRCSQQSYLSEIFFVNLFLSSRLTCVFCVFVVSSLFPPNTNISPFNFAEHETSALVFGPMVKSKFSFIPPEMFFDSFMTILSRLIEKLPTVIFDENWSIAWSKRIQYQDRFLVRFAVERITRASKRAIVLRNAWLLWKNIESLTVRLLPDKDNHRIAFWRFQYMNSRILDHCCMQ